MSFFFIGRMALVNSKWNAGKMTKILLVISEIIAKASESKS